MNTNFSTIPLPNFQFSEFINRKAREYCDNHFSSLGFFAPEDNNNLRKELNNLNNSKDRIQFTGYVINFLVEIVNSHEKECNNSGCMVVPDSQDLLYFLYGILEENNVHVDEDAFTREDIVINNAIILEISHKIEDIIMGENILFDDIQLVINDIKELQITINNLKELQIILGKKKWYQTLGGIILEYATNKGMDGILIALKPLLLRLGAALKITNLIN